MPSSSYDLEKTSEPAVYRRGKSYVFIYRAPGGKQKKAYALTFAAAKHKKHEIIGAIKRNEYQEVQRVAFEDYAREWLTTYTGRTSKGISSEHAGRLQGET